MINRKFIVSALALLLAACSQEGGTLPAETLTIHNRTFTLEIANTEETRQRGLMYRDQMGRDHGMIFLFEKADAYRFWMKNTRISLDLIYIHDDHVAGIFTLQPYDEVGVRNAPVARAVIELNAGAAKELGLKEGDPLALPEKFLKLMPRGDETK